MGDTMSENPLKYPIPKPKLPPCQGKNGVVRNGVVHHPSVMGMHFVVPTGMLPKILECGLH